MEENKSVGRYGFIQKVYRQKFLPWMILLFQSTQWIVAIRQTGFSPTENYTIENTPIENSHTYFSQFYLDEIAILM